MFGSRLTLFEVLGFKVHIDASWLLLAVLIVWSLAAGYFPSVAPGYGLATYWTMGLAGLVGLALSIVVHELAHSLVARRFDMRIAGITLFVFGGVAEMAAEPAAPKGEFLMAIAGPLMSLVVAGLAWGVVQATAAFGVAAENPAVVVMDYLATINLFLAAFNMVPAFPLDGGRVLRAALWAWRHDLRWATRAAAGAGIGCAFALMALGVWSVATGAWVAGVWWFVLGLFLRAAADQTLRQQSERMAAAGTVAGLMRPPPPPVPADLTLDRFAADFAWPSGEGLFPVVDGDGAVVGCVRPAVVRNVPPAEWPSRQVAEMAEDCTVFTISDEARLAEALDRLRVAGGSLLVVRGGSLVGTLSLADLAAHLTVRNGKGLSEKYPS